MATNALQIDTRDRAVRILHIASEAVPWAKTGGLADVVGALCGHLAAAGHDVTLALPLYRAVAAVGVALDGSPVTAALDGRTVDIRTAESEAGFRVWFVDAPDLFDREGLYGEAGVDYPDNADRFATFVRAVLAGVSDLGPVPDIIHSHDWQGALAPVYLESGDGLSGEPDPATVLTVHNLAYQGVYPARVAAAAGIPDVEAVRQGDSVGFLKGGLLSADQVTTVSPRYAREIATPVLGFGLDPWIANLEPPVLGILNGIDTSVWNPAADPYLAATYDATDLTGKATCKRALQAEMGLALESDVPLFGMVSRLVGQKGLSLIADLGDELVEREAQFVFLGTGEARYEELVADLAARHPNVAARLAFSEELAHRIEAGADFFLMPSRFEPCGLNQMISQRYGTPPVVHRVGGLADSVTHASPGALAEGEATGVVFDQFDAPSLSRAVDFARDLYGDGDRIAAVRRAGMQRDFSWRRSGLEYEALYRRVLEDKHGAA